MQQIVRRLRSMVNRFPAFKRFLRPLYYQFTNELPVTAGELSADFLKSFIGKDDPVILEIGANDGSHTVWFKELFPNSVIHCFEPNPSALLRFQKNVERLSGVFLYEVAISRTNGQLKFYPSSEMLSTSGKQLWDASGSLREPTGHLKVHPEISFAEPFEVPAVRLDDWRREHGVHMIDFIWMDVQGAELDVFAGAGETLKKTRYLYTEYAVEELYKGQPSLREIRRALPEFNPIIRYLNDILLRNKRLLYD